MKEKKISCRTAKSISCLETLKLLGFHPKNVIGPNAWFLSPLRSEDKASFKVDINLNRWYDHGAGIGGNVIDLVCLIKKCSIKEALQILSKENISFSFQPPFSSQKNKILGFLFQSTD